MSRNIVPRVNKGADLGTSEKNWNRLYADTVILRNNDLQTLLNNKTDIDILTTKGDLYVATNTGIITRLPAGADGYVLKSNSMASEGLMWGPAGARQELTGNITVTVGPGGNFPTINAALESIVALYYPTYISGNNNINVTINLLPGFIMNEQVFVKSLNLSWITITGGYQTETIINYEALTSALMGVYPAFAAINGGFLPIINQLFNMNILDDSITTNYHGIMAYNNSKANISSNCGVKNAHTNISAYNSSIINADSANASEAGYYGIMASRNSIINAAYANASKTIPNNYEDIKVQHGSLINAFTATGSLSQTPNAITKDGIIFKP